jgi:hypothetical protein
MITQTDPVFGPDVTDPNTTQSSPVSPTPTAKPGSLGFNPVNSELGFVEETTTIAQETAPTEAQQEKSEINEEKVTQPKKEQTQPQQDPEPAPNLNKMQPVPNVVDKTNIKTDTHTVVHTHDKLTSIADKEEEEFIKEVETAHGHK